MRDQGGIAGRGDRDRQEQTRHVGAHPWHEVFHPGELTPGDVEAPLNELRPAERVVSCDRGHGREVAG
jgi:hypothetical protein